MIYVIHSTCSYRTFQDRLHYSMFVVILVSRLEKGLRPFGKLWAGCPAELSSLKGGTWSTRQSGIRLRKLRPKRSSFQTMSVSPSCNALRQWSRAGRFDVTPDMPSSLKTVLTWPLQGRKLQGCVLVVGQYAGVALFHWFRSARYRRQRAAFQLRRGYGSPLRNSAKQLKGDLQCFHRRGTFRHGCFTISDQTIRGQSD